MDPPVAAAGCLDVRERLLRSTRRAATPRCCAAEIADAKRALSDREFERPNARVLRTESGRRDQPFREPWTSSSGAASARSQFDGRDPADTNQSAARQTARTQRLSSWE
jgi:hypothetical protein